MSLTGSEAESRPRAARKRGGWHGARSQNHIEGTESLLPNEIRSLENVLDLLDHVLKRGCVEGSAVYRQPQGDASAR